MYKCKRILKLRTNSEEQIENQWNCKYFYIQERILHQRKTHLPKRGVFLIYLTNYKSSELLYWNTNFTVHYRTIFLKHKQEKLKKGKYKRHQNFQKYQIHGSKQSTTLLSNKSSCSIRQLLPFENSTKAVSYAHEVQNGYILACLVNDIPLQNNAMFLQYPCRGKDICRALVFCSEACKDSFFHKASCWIPRIRGSNYFEASTRVEIATVIDMTGAGTSITSLSNKNPGFAQYLSLHDLTWLVAGSLKLASEKELPTFRRTWISLVWRDFCTEDFVTGF